MPKNFLCGNGTAEPFRERHERWVKKCEKNFVCVDAKVKKIFLKDKYFLNQFLTFEIR